MRPADAIQLQPRLREQNIIPASRHRTESIVHAPVPQINVPSPRVVVYESKAQAMIAILRLAAAGEEFRVTNSPAGPTISVAAACQIKIDPENELTHLVIQEGGSSSEFYLQAFDELDHAFDCREKCTSESAYRTSPVISVPTVFADLVLELDLQEAIFNIADCRDQVEHVEAEEDEESVPVPGEAPGL